MLRHGVLVALATFFLFTCVTSSHVQSVDPVVTASNETVQPVPDNTSSNEKPAEPVLTSLNSTAHLASDNTSPQVRQLDPASRSDPEPTESKNALDAVSENDDTKVAYNRDVNKDNPEFTFRTFVTIFVTLTIVLSNCAILMVASWTDAFSNFNKTFIYSLTLADLLIGLFITPYSVFLSVYNRWIYTSEMFCSVEAYLFTTLMTAKLYSLTWLNVDHYVAVRKPERYNVMMSPTRSLCWIVFSWIVAISFCCPPLFSFESAVFNKAISICMIDTKQQVAYILTAGVLVSIPSLFAMSITGAYLFTKSFKKRIQFYEKVYVELSSRPSNYYITCILCLLYIIVWIPFVIINLVVKRAFQTDVDDSLQFAACWVGISASFSQFFVLLILSADFRFHFLEICQLPGWCVWCNQENLADSTDVNFITIPVKR